MSVKKFLGIYCSYAANYAKVLLASRGDFLTWLTAGLLFELSSLFFIFILYFNIDNLNGWTVYELLLLKGIFLVPVGLAYFIFHGFIYDFSEKYIIRGRLTVTLIRPVNPYLMVLSENAGLSEISAPVIGLALIIISYINLDIVFNPMHILILLMTVACGTLIIGGIFTGIACLAFFMSTKAPLFEIIESLEETGQYPLTIYPGFIQVLITFVIPLGLVSYYPSSALLNIENPVIYLWLLPLLAIVFFSTGYLSWKRGRLRYNGSAT